MEASEEFKERRRVNGKHSQGRFHFDRTINVSNLIAFVSILTTIISYSNQVIHYLKVIDDKVNIMWIDFAKTHPDADDQLKQLEGKRF